MSFTDIGGAKQEMILATDVRTGKTGMTKAISSTSLRGPKSDLLSKEW
jgi:hypothetical protein